MINSIFILLKRETLIFIKNINSYLFFIFTFPVILYLFLINPFFGLLKSSSGMSYLYHGMPAILFLCSLISSFFMPLIILIRDRYQNNYFEFLFTLNINIYSYSIYIMIASLIFSYVHFFVSLILVVQLSQMIIISWKQLIYFSIVIFPSSLLFCLLGMLISNFVRNIYSIIMTLIFLFSFLAFGIGSFIPIEYFSDKYSDIVQSYNLIFHLYYMLINILQGENVNLAIPISSIFISVIVYILHIMIFSKKINKY